MAYERREFPEWSWSDTRRRILAACPRRYYYHYYVSHNGWEYDAPPLARQAYRLKSLTNLHLARSEALHRAAIDVVHRANSDGDLPTVEEVTDEIRQMLTHTYHNAQMDTIERKTETCVSALLKSRSVQESRAPDTQIITVDSLDHFYLLDTKIYAIPDLLYRRGDNRWILVDWKTGDEDPDYATQLKVYALYAKNRHSVPSQDLICRLEYLNKNECQEWTVTDDELRATERTIAHSIAFMRSLLADSVENRPQPIEAFPLRPEKGLCPQCNFYEMCQSQLKQGSAEAAPS